MIDSHRDEIAKLESLYAMNPEGRVFTHLAEACRKAGQLDRARQILEEGLQKHPDYASAHVVLGRVFADSGEDDAAVGEFRRVLELDRHNLIAMRSLGEIAARSGRTDEATHYYGELAVLDPTDPEIQETLRRLRDRQATAPAEPSSEAGITAVASAVEPAGKPDEPAESEESRADAPAADDEIETSEAADDAGSTGLVIDTVETFGVYGVEDVERVEGLESASVEPEPSDAWPVVGADLPEWPMAEPAGEVEQPGEDAPIDHAAWHEIAAGGSPAEPSDEPPTDEAPGAEPAAAAPPADERTPEEASAAEPQGEEPQPFVASSGEVTRPLEEDHLRFVPPGMFGRQAGQAETEAPEPAETGQRAVESESGVDERGEAETESAMSPAEDEPREMEGRWQAPGSSHGDVQAERDGPTDHSGEWIPEDRWEWVAASADTSGSAEEPEPDEDPDAASSPETGAGAAPGAWDEETSFAGLTDDEDAPAAYGIDDEVSFAGLADEDDEDAVPAAGSDEDVSFAGIAESGPVDSFEEGAAAVLDAYARTEGEEGDDAGAEPAAEPAFVTDPGAGEDDAPVSWVTESEDDGDLVITETLAEIYASQGLYDRAAAVYRRLIEHHPDDDRLHARLADLESATGWAEAGEQAGASNAEADREAFIERVESAWTGGEGAASMEDSPYAWAEQEPEEAEAGPSAADYFAGLLAWRPTETVPSIDDEPAGSGAVPLTEDWYAEESDREPAAGGEVDGVGREGEEDLEMFRSWLKSLKK